MAGLQRSMETFRRSGSSGLVWDDKFTAQIDEQMKNKSLSTKDFTLKHELPIMSSCSSVCRPVKISPVAAEQDDPPSPTISAWCGLFGSKRLASTKRMPAARSRKHR